MPKVIVQVIAALAFAFGIAACGDRECRIPQGRWANREGQVFIFNPDGKGLWLTRFGSTFDTIPMQYSLDCSADPLQIDMMGFKGAMYEDKQLYGILEWSSDTTFRIVYEFGTSPSERPSTFESDLTQKFYKDGL